MLLLRRLLWHAARYIALDPRARAKAAELLEKEVKPRARAAWRQAKPKLDAAKAELRDAAREANPPGGKVEPKAEVAICGKLAPRFQGQSTPRLLPC